MLQVEAKLLAEVDAFGRTREVRCVEDLDELPYLEACINEALRLYPPGFFTIRRVGRRAGGRQGDPGKRGMKSKVDYNLCNQETTSMRCCCACLGS